MISSCPVGYVSLFQFCWKEATLRMKTIRSVKVLICRVNIQCQGSRNVKAKLGEYHNGGSGDMNMFVITGFNALVWLCLAGIM